MRPRSLLDGFFTSDVDAVTRATASLLADSADDADRSHGHVTNRDALGGRGRFERGGVLCPQIFGPIAPLACTCGKTTGDAQRGVVCDKCGVLCGDPEVREWRFGHVVLAGAVHPLLLDEVARALEISRAELDAMLAPNFDTDADVSDTPGFEIVEARLRERGRDDLCAAAIVRAIPVPPPGDRPLVKDLAPTMRTPWIGPVSQLWQQLIERANRQARLHELGAPPIILANDGALVQRSLAAVVQATVTPPPPLPESWRIDVEDEVDIECTGAIELPERWRSTWRDDELTAPVGIRALFFLDDGALLVQRAREALVVRDGAVMARHASCVRAARSQHGTRVVFEDPLVAELPEGASFLAPPDGPRDGAQVAERARDPESNPDDTDDGNSDDTDDGNNDDTDDGQHDDDVPPQTGLAVLDLATGSYARAFPRDIPCVEGEKGEPEDLWLRDVRSGAQFASPFCGNDRPQVLGWTRDARFAWLGSEDDGGVVEVDTGIPQVIPTAHWGDAGDAPPGIPFAPDAARDADATVAAEDEYVSATALALTPACEWRFASGGDGGDGPQLRVYDEQRTLFTIDGPVVCAAFSADASQLAVAISDDVLIVDVNARRVLARFRVP